MGSFDGAETCELVGTFLLNKINSIFNNEVGLYRDDGLAVLRNHSPSQAERVSKTLISEFHNHGLRITVSHSMKSVNFLDTTLDLNKKIHRPYQKVNNIIQYVNTKSNHPANVIKAIPKSINTRLSNISSNAEQFDLSSEAYKSALENAGHQQELKFNPPRNAQRPRQRHRNVTWFNPPFSKSVKTNVGKKFLQLIDTNFPEDNKLHKIFNRNTVKVSYSCTDNMARIVNSHNKAIEHRVVPPTRTCNCRNELNCPLDGKCLTNTIVYKAEVKSQEGTKAYIGASDTHFKTRWNNHTSSFRNENRRSQTALSKYIWSLKEKNVNYELKWSVLKRTTSYNNSTKRCQLCGWEKYFIITTDKNVLLNNRSELVSTCRHASKYLLINV